ncbi:MAG: hypothetical protein QNI87_08650 [Erythrobacter sp.]|uniref:hypothetical protein n=1 Tax=Erythrobacter sp. TaxID=1042 RepID=UPI00263434D7|nr:hypothetical protein [Erythrobacter sp.]MDJ0978593.1 hypothetical protein [Erythrobacter sp.]
MERGLHRRTLALALVIGLAPASVNAQTFGASTGAGAVETRAMVGVTIPFGAKRRQAETRPRFDLRLEAADYRPDFNDAPDRRIGLQPRRNVRRVSLSWTMEDRPRFLLNGRVLESQYRLSADEDTSEENEEGTQEKKGTTTGQKVLRGAAVAGGVMVVIAGIGLIGVLTQCDGDDGC